MRRDRPTSRCAKVREVLFEAPSSNAELEVMLGWTKRQVISTVAVLVTYGHAEKVGKVPNIWTGERTGIRRVGLYRLTGPGRRLVKEYREWRGRDQHAG